MSTIKANNYEASTAGNNLIFKTNNAERMRIDTSGNIGIGLANPATKLHISGSSSTYESIYLANSSSASFVQMFAAGSSGVPGGGVPGYSTWIEGAPASSGNTVLSSYYNNLVFATGTSRTERMRIDSSGKVGIGTASPAVALDVSGEARSSTSTTDASNAKTLTTKDYVDFSVYSFDLTIDDYANAGRLGSGSPGSTAVRNSAGTVTQANATTITVNDLRIGRVYTRVHRTIASPAPNHPPFTQWIIDNTGAVSLVWTAFYTTANTTPFSGSLPTTLTLASTAVNPYKSNNTFATSTHTASTYGYAVVWVMRI